MNGSVLVTGASGFVGRALLARLLELGRPVIALTQRHVTDLPPGVIQRITAPIETLDHEDWLAALEGADRVIHAAGIAHIAAGIAEDRYDAVNHRATAALAEAARQAGTSRIVLLSSIRAQTGASTPDVQTEDTVPAPQDAYGRSKLAAERALAASGVEYTILRPVVVVGQGAKGNVASLLRIALLPVPLPVGGLAARRSLVGLDALAHLAIAATDAPPMANQTYVVADPEPLTLGEMVGAVRAGMGRTPGVFAVPEWLLALPFLLTGNHDLWQRFAAPQVAHSLRLTDPEFDCRGCAREALRSLGQSMSARG